MRRLSGHTHRRVLVLLAASMLLLGLPAGIANAGPSGGRSSVPDSRPAWMHTAQAVGAPAASATLSFDVVLPLRDAAGAAKLAASVSDPSSADYGHYVTPAAFNAKYAPTADQVTAVRSFLRAQGLSVTGVAAGNRWISASGTVRQAEAAFGTTLRTYSHDGQTVREPATTLSVPDDVAPLVAGVIGIGSEDARHVPANRARLAPAGRSAPLGAVVKPAATASCSTYWSQHTMPAPSAYGKTSFPTTNCGYTATQIRTAYGVQPSVVAGDTGSGVTVAIVDAYASPTILSDANDLADQEGEPEFASGQYQETVFTPFTDQTDCQGEAGWNQEESLDVEAVHEMAPGANIHYVGAANCEDGIDTAMNWIVQNHAADIVSDSFSDLGEDGLGSEVALEDSIFQQAAAEGIGFYFATGDDGDNVVPGGTLQPEPDFPATDPWVTAVGGTSLAVTSSGAYDFETAWGDYYDFVDGSTYDAPLPGTFAYGGGGGVSSLFTEPSYQQGIVPSSLAKLNGSTAMRVIPDVSALADPGLGLLIEYGGALGVIGGTSLACPAIAGIQALASQNRIFPIGFANPELYSLGSTAFHDVVASSSTRAMMYPDEDLLFTLDLDTSLSASSGFDDATGRGTPNGLNFLLGERLLSSRVVPGVIHTE